MSASSSSLVVFLLFPSCELGVTMVVILGVALYVILLVAIVESMYVTGEVVRSFQKVPLPCSSSALSRKGRPLTDYAASRSRYD